MSQILTSITQQYQSATSGWYDYLFPMANHLFGMLAVIEIAWCGITWALERQDITTFWSEFVKKVLVIGFFYAILLHANTWIPDIIRSFILAGAGAAHIQTLDPSSILSQGIAIASAVFKPLDKLGLLRDPGAVLIGAFSSLIIVSAFAVIAGLLVVTLVESYIVVSAGILMLGFSGSEFTRKYALGYLSYSFSVGAKLFMLYLVIGVGANIASQWDAMLLNASIHDFSPFFEVLGGAITYLFLAWAIPAKASSLISGSSNATFSGLAGTAATVGGIAVGAGMAAATAGVGGLMGGMEAIKQAHTIAQGHSGNKGVGVAKGIAGAGMNLAGSMAGSLSGHHANTASAMAGKTRGIQSKQHAKRESSAAGQSHQRPNYTNPPNSATNPVSSAVSAAAQGAQAPPEADTSVQAPNSQ